ncbi:MULTISPECIES: hypothetical protein [Rhodococcus]|nr:hypothetical protein [Rhodococcus sp. ACS1]
MLAAERHRRMTEALRVSRIVSTEEFSRLLGVSPRSSPESAGASALF